MILDDVDGFGRVHTPQALTPSKTIPKSQQDIPVVYGVRPNYLQIAGLHLFNGRFFDRRRTTVAPVCVLGIAAKFNLFGAVDPIGQYVKVNEQWFRVIGVVSPQLSAQSEVSAGVLRRRQQHHLRSLECGLAAPGRQLQRGARRN